MFRHKYIFVILLIVLSLTFFLVGYSAAQDWPTSAITVIVPSSAGGGLDVFVRQIQPFLSEKLGVPIKVDNRVGGQAVPGRNMVIQAEPDGYTLGAYTAPEVEIATIAIDDIPFTLDDFIILAMGVADAGVIRVHNDAPWQTFKEFCEYAKENPGEISVSVSQLTSPYAVFMQQLGDYLGTEFTVTSFGGGNPARIALAGKHVDATCAAVHNSLHIDEQTRVIAVVYDENIWPDLTDNAPTVNEVLGSDLPMIGSFYGIFASAEFKEKYPERFEKLSQTILDILNSNEYYEVLKEIGVHTKLIAWDSERSMKFIRENYEMYNELRDLIRGSF